MAVKSEQIEKNLTKLTFEVESEIFEKAINRAYKKNVKKINIPGFRKGKAPKAVIEKYYGENVFYEDAINDVLPEAYDKALEESGLDAVARPEIDVEDIKRGEAVVFTALVTTRPEVKLGQYKGIEVDKIEHNVTEEDVDKDIDAVRRQNARMITIEDRAVENGDIANINFEGFVDGEAFAGGKGDDFDLEIGSGTFIPGFEEQIIGAQTGAEIEVNVTFPEEYHSEQLAGKPAMFKVKVNEIKKRELPEADDDFASEVSEFETMAEYRQSVKEKLEKTAAEKAETETENAVIDKVVENAEVDIPAAMIDMQVERQLNQFAQRLSFQGLNMDDYMRYTGTNMDMLKEQYRPAAEKQVRGSLVLEAVMNAEGIVAEPEEVEADLVDMSKKYNMELDKLKELLSDTEMENIKKDLAINKTITMLVNNAVVK